MAVNKRTLKSDNKDKDLVVRLSLKHDARKLSQDTRDALYNIQSQFEDKLIEHLDDLTSEMREDVEAILDVDETVTVSVLIV